MRKIKFKAKQLNSGEWLEGDLVHLRNRVFIGGDNIKDGITDVDPETVCQFTGLKDCDGNEIWEGDVVDREIYDFFKGIDIRKSVIEYIGGAFVAVTDGIPYSICSKYINVIGNKFDNN